MALRKLQKELHSCVCLLALCVWTVYADECAEGGVYVVGFNKCYYFMTAQLLYTDAANNCAAIKGRLVSINSAFEETYLLAEAQQRFSGGDYWIGLSDFNEDGVWVWSDGKQSSFTFWNTGFPKRVHTFDCAAAVGKSGRWYNTECSVQISFVCETDVTDPKIPTTTAPSCLNCSPRAVDLFASHTADECRQQQEPYSWCDAIRSSVDSSSGCKVMTVECYCDDSFKYGCDNNYFTQFAVYYNGKNHGDIYTFHAATTRLTLTCQPNGLWLITDTQASDQNYYFDNGTDSNTKSPFIPVDEILCH